MLANALDKRNQFEERCTEEVWVSVCAGIMIVWLENTREITGKLSQTIKESRKVTVQKLVERN